MSSTTSAFRECADEEKSSGDDLVGRIVSIFWDGDDEYYPCEVTSYNDSSKEHTVVYFDGNEKSSEVLSEVKLKLWSGTKSEFNAYYKEESVSN